MNKIIVSAWVLAASVLASCGGQSTTESKAPEAPAVASEGAVSMAIDTTASSLGWKAKKVTAEHHGIIRVRSGELKVDSGKPVAGKFIIDMNSIVVQDLTDPTMNGKLLGHLKSDDFFSAATHPEGVFEITSAEPVSGATADQPNFLIKGNLTLKGITKPIEFPALVKAEGDALQATGEAVLDRTLWDIRYGSGKFFKGLGDKMIYDTFSVLISIKAVKA